MQMLIIAANKRHTLLFTRWENHSFQFCREKIWISATVTLRYWSRTAEQYSAISSISGRIHGSRRRIWIQTEDCVPSFVTLPRTKQVFVTKIISINLQIHAYRWWEYAIAFWHCPAIKRSGAVYRYTSYIYCWKQQWGYFYTRYPKTLSKLLAGSAAVRWCGPIRLFYEHSQGHLGGWV